MFKCVLILLYFFPFMLILTTGKYLSKHDKCEPCYSTCYKCTGPEREDCISCPSSRFFDNGQCVIHCEPGKHERDGKCLLCHHTCLECTDEGPKKCTQCSKDHFGVNRYLFDGECRENCPEGYYHSLKGTCDPCPPNCSVCTSKDYCLHCTPSYYSKDGMCSKLECGMGAVADPDHEDCVTCEQGCQECLIVDPEKCISCLLDYYQLGSSCHKTCPPKTFEDKSLMKCAGCNDHCETCDSSDCFLCEEGFFLSDGTCTKTCKEGFYGDIKQECEPCHHTCRTCGGPNYNDCDSCEEYIILERGQCFNKTLIKCSDGTFLNGHNECESCNSSCKTCSWHDQCDSCEKGKFLTNSQMCISVCPPETHGNQTSGRCEDCSAGCLTCRDAHYCLYCKDSFDPLYLQDGKCVAQCKRGYPEAGVCNSCATGCASCEGEPNYCLSCDEDYLLLKHTCVLDCPSRHFVKNGVCERCPNSCTECDQIGKCSECEKYFFLHKDKCVVDCPKGYFTNIEKKQCIPCHSNCATCNGPDEDDCSSCRVSEHISYNGKCMISCPSDTYLEGEDCRDCDKSCLMCSGPSPSSCVTCRANMRIDGNGHCEFVKNCSTSTFMDGSGQCQPCHQSCLHCSGTDKDQCLSCKPKHFLLNQTCVSMCPDGYYEDKDKQECVQCHLNCASCHGHHSNDCVTCKPSLLLLGHSCFTTCPPSFFVNATSKACQECDHSCEECSGSSSFCLRCRDGYYLMRKSGQCLHKCPSNYFPDTLYRECKRCHATCKTCKGSGAIFCTSCYKGFQMFGGICSSICLIGQYHIPENNTCATCDLSCNECKGAGPYNCTWCPALQRLSEDGRCLPCCGENIHTDDLRFASECCQCQELNDECTVVLNYNLLNNDPVTSGRSGIVVFIVISVLMSLWLAIFLFLHFRQKITSKPIIQSNGYAKIDDGPFTSATLKDIMQGEYCDKFPGQDDEEEDGDDIVYMGRDGIVYKKFKFNPEGEEESGAEELEYDDMYNLT